MAAQVSPAALALGAQVNIVSYGRDGATPPVRKHSTVQAILDGGVEAITTPGIQVIFMPAIRKHLKKEDSPTVVNRLVNTFRIPPWFFERTGWNANGLFGSQINPLQDPNNESYSIFARFLTKHVFYNEDGRKTRGIEPPKVNELIVGYEWSYMAFYALWRSPDTTNQTGSKDKTVPKSTDGTLLLFCFDLAEQVEKSITKVLADLDVSACLLNPYTIFGKVCRDVTQEFDDALWSFQPFVRYIESTRFDFTEEFTVDLDKLNTRYAGIHELSRHTLHVVETAEVAARTFGALLKDSETFSPRNISEADGKLVSDMTKQTIKELQLWSGIISNLKERAQAFADRLKIEAQLSSNIAAAYDAKVLAFLQQSRAENESLTNTVAGLTLLFLPGTFISGFFGMNFFTLSSDQNTPGIWGFTSRIWIFFATTIPITFVALFLFTLDLNLIEAMKKYFTEPLTRCFGKREPSGITRALTRQSTTFHQNAGQSVWRRKPMNGAAT